MPSCRERGTGREVPGEQCGDTAESGARFDPADNKPQSHAKSTRPAVTNPAGLSDRRTDQLGVVLLLLLLTAEPTAFVADSRRITIRHGIGVGLTTPTTPTPPFLPSPPLLSCTVPRTTALSINGCVSASQKKEQEISINAVTQHLTKISIKNSYRVVILNVFSRLFDVKLEKLKECSI